MALGPQRLVIRHTSTDNFPPTGLMPGELSAELGTPLRLWIGVDTAIDNAGKKLLVPQPAVTVGDTPPAVPSPNLLWWESDTGILWLWYNDGGSSQWVQVSNSGAKAEDVVTDADEIRFEPGGALSADDVQEALMELDQEKVAKAGDTMTGFLTLNGNPTAALHAVPKQYVDAADTTLQTAINGKLGEAPADGQTYGRNNAAWVVVTAGGGGTAASGITFTPGGNLSSSNVQNALTELDNEKVAKAGDTMTGDLIISKATAQLVLNKPAAGQSVGVFATLGGAGRWNIQLGDGIAESGGNAGSNFNIFRYSDAGSLNSTPVLSINRATGLVTVASDPTTALGVATKQYVDGKITGLAPVPIAFPFAGKPTASARVNVPVAIILNAPASLAGSLAYASVATTADAVFTVNKVSSGGSVTAVGTVTVKASGVHTFAGAGGMFAVGDVLQVVAPATQDATLADVGITILMQRG